MNLLESIDSVALIVPEMKASNRWEAIDELVEVLVRAVKIKAEQREAVTGALRKRETSMSTGIGLGIGLPHGVTPFVTDIVAAFGRSQKGIEFDSLDNRPVNLVVLYLCKETDYGKSMEASANMAKLLLPIRFRATLLAATTAEEILRVIRSA